MDASTSFSVPPGAYTVAELALPSGWTLNDLVCVDPTANTTWDIGTATATINLASLETVTCTFTNYDYPTAIDFTAAPEVVVGDDFVVVKWETSPDAARSAFKLYRSEGLQGEKVLVEAGLLGEPHEFVDFGVQRGKTYFYWVELIEEFLRPVLLGRARSGGDLEPAPADRDEIGFQKGVQGSFAGKSTTCESRALLADRLDFIKNPKGLQTFRVFDVLIDWYHLSEKLT